eukprot:scaffold3123_cov105-Isochrysis_galbana.AAC.2
MTDPPIDHTQAREQDAPGTHDAKRRAPVHGHTGDVPSDKALSDMQMQSLGWSRPSSPRQELRVGMKICIRGKWRQFAQLPPPPVGYRPKIARRAVCLNLDHFLLWTLAYCQLS